MPSGGIKWPVVIGVLSGLECAVENHRFFVWVLGDDFEYKNGGACVMQESPSGDGLMHELNYADLR